MNGDRKLHRLRHAAVTLLGARGVPLKAIAEIVGHSDIRLTRNVYQHVFQPAKREAADQMNALLEDAVARVPVEKGLATKPATTTLN